MQPDVPTAPTIRACTPSDQTAVQSLIEPYVKRRKILRRTFDEFEELLPNSFVAELGGRIVAFVAIEIYSQKLAEIRSLVVDPEFQRQHLGRQMVAACVERARQQNVFEVMAVTSAEDFIRSCGFDYTLPGEKKAFFLQTREEH
jgi:N-acetylglutamate synthase-like GNAT family acetyltransferase